MTKPLDPIEATTATRAGKPEGNQAPTSATVTNHAADAHGAVDASCANCGTVLTGEYCHHCGQFAHNPLTSFRHAVEDVFESFWHLDGRIFRTLRDLFLPGRVARNYLAGHRVRYIPPLRLFVILSLLTFFVGKLVLHVEPQFNVGGESISFAADRSISEVERRRDRLLAKLEQEEAADTGTPGANPVLIAARARIQGQAAARIAQLRGEPKAGDAPPAVNAARPVDHTVTADPIASQERGDPAANEPQAANTTTTAPDSTAPAASTPPGTARADATQADREQDCDALIAGSRQAAWVPDVASRWIKQRVRKGCENFKHFDTEGGRILEAFLAAVPTALFVLMPLFALLLKLLYLGSGRSYLEHLVVALYSHCYLLLMLLGLFLLSALDDTAVPGWLTGPVIAAIWIWTPIYLWKTQRRMYGGAWWSNALRFATIGVTYVVLVALATVYAVLIGISS